MVFSLNIDYIAKHTHPNLFFYQEHKLTIQPMVGPLEQCFFIKGERMVGSLVTNEAMFSAIANFYLFVF